MKVSLKNQLLATINVWLAYLIMNGYIIIKLSSLFKLGLDVSDVLKQTVIIVIVIMIGFHLYIYRQWEICYEQSLTYYMQKDKVRLSVKHDNN